METSSALPAGMCTFLFTDIEGSARLVKANGREGCRELFETDTRVIRLAMARNDVVEVDRQGDSFFAVFRRTGQTIVAAVEAQQAVVEQRWADARTGRRVWECTPARWPSAGGLHPCRRP